MRPLILTILLVVSLVLISGCAQQQVTYTQTPSPTPTSSPTVAASETFGTQTSPSETRVAKQAFDYGSLTKYANNYYRFSKEAYDAALSEGKTVYLYFLANWCPICKEDRPKILQTFNKISYPDVIGFEVHFNDDQVTEDDKEITKKYQVPYQHTTVVDKTGKIFFKSPEPLSEEQIITRIESLRG